MNPKKNKLYTIGFVVLIVIIVAVLWLVSIPKQGNASLDGFARCIAQKGIVMYGLATCPHCQNQKAEFGTSFQYIHYVECTENIQECTNKGINEVPAWILPSGEKVVGEQTLQQLSQASGCSLPASK